MIQTSRYYLLKNKQQIEVRTPQVNEAQAALDMMIEVSAHSPYILSTPESFKKRSLENQIKWFEENQTSQNAIILAVFEQTKMIGFANGQSYKDIKRRHRAVLGITIHQNYRGLGIGQILMSLLIENMKKFSNIKIIELDVMVKNIAAIKMYEKIGFKKAGVFPNAFILENEDVSDNLTMYLEVQ